MKEISLEEAKRIMLDVFKDVALFCDENGLRYFMAYGTLLGAARHKGFIPWDDDIDIMMPRPDYEKFVSLYHQHGHYAITAPLIDKNCFFVYAKVFDESTIKYEEGIDYSRLEPNGIDIDVFPLDGIPNEKYKKQYLFVSKIRYKLCKLLRRSIAPPHQKHLSIKGKLANVVLNPFCRLLGKDFFIRLYLRIAKMYTYNDCDYVHVAFPSKASIRTKHAKQLFSESIKLTFEDSDFWAPIGYDEYLRSLYGDYMKMPPVEKQKTHHMNNMFWK